MDKNEQKIGMKGNCAGDEIVGIENENASEKEAVKELLSSSTMKENASAKIESPPKEKARKSIYLSQNVFDEVLDWIKRTELAQSSLSTSSLTFHQYCFLKLHGKKVKSRIVPLLEFARVKDDQGNWKTILNKLVNNNHQSGTVTYPDRWLSIPIADVNPPDYIIGFEKIEFRFIDDLVLQFARKILPVFMEKFDIHYHDDWTDELNSAGQVGNLISLMASKTKELSMWQNDCNDLSDFNQQFRNFITEIPSICVSNCISDVDSLAKWLTEPREDGKQKLLKFYYDKMTLALIDRIKEDFSNSNEPANFIIYMRHNEEMEHFEIENEKTRELLELYENPNPPQYVPSENIFIRHKNDGQKETIPIEWEEELEKFKKDEINPDEKIIIYF